MAERFDFRPQAIIERLDLLRRAGDVKRDHREGRRTLPLSGRTLGLFFEKPSLRTRVSVGALPPFLIFCAAEVSARQSASPRFSPRLT